MSRRNGPNIVTNGLVLYLDAANRQSYVSGSTVWNDVSNNGNTGTLTNGPTFSSANGGSIVFDGVNDYINNVGTTSTFSFIQNTGIYTLTTWIKPSVLGTAMYFAGNNSGTQAQKGFYCGKEASNNFALVFTDGSGVANFSHRVNNFFLNTTDWVHVVCVGNSTTSQFYRNGTTFGSVGTITSLSTGNSSQTLAIGSINDVLAYNYWWSGNIASFQIYNRALSATEVLQNYNATKARFGL